MNPERARQAALVQAALRGEEHAREELGALAEEYLRRRFFRHARRCYGDSGKEELEDITSDAMEKCLTRLDRFRGERALFTTWVYGFAKNVLRDHHRKRARRDRIWREAQKDQTAWWHGPPPEEPRFGSDPLRWVIRQEKLEALRLAMADLPADAQVMLTLRAAEARSGAETARRLKLGEEAAEKRYQCALELLRERYFRYYYGAPRRKSPAPKIALDKGASRP